MKITFMAFNKTAGVTGEKPKAAIKAIPKWFSKIPRFVNNDKKFKIFSNSTQNATIKWCTPFLDSLATGYFLTLENDVQITLEEGTPSFTWKSGGANYVDTHAKNQVSPNMIPQGYSDQPYKFKNDWSIKTPKGYSALFVHPLNRGDLPFYTLSGFVDTDDYNVPVNIPFLIRADFEGIIPAGTPIAQIIPIKRESWVSEIAPYNEDFITKSSAKFNSTIYRAYKTLFWKRKDYR
jgi:hypothetical protein